MDGFRTPFDTVHLLNHLKCRFTNLIPLCVDQPDYSWRIGRSAGKTEAPDLAEHHDCVTPVRAFDSPVDLHPGSTSNRQKGK